MDHNGLKIEAAYLKQPKMLAFVLMLYVTFSIASIVLALKVVHIDFLLLTAAAFFLPFRYLLGDIISEIYGYRMAQRAIFSLMACVLLFSVMVGVVSKFPSPPYWNHQSAYDFVLGESLRVTLCASISMLAGASLNVYILSRWRLLMSGKHFWLRSIGSSTIGELTQYCIGLTLVYWNSLPFEKIVHLIISDYAVQVGFILCLAPLAQVAMLVIRKMEGYQPDQHKVDFHPFAGTE